MASGNKIVIAFLSVSTANATDQLIEQIKRNDNFRCVFVKLTQQDLQSFKTGETYDAVVLLHSISQGRNSITDVADAKYSKLLPQLKKIYGPDRVAVVVHSMTSFNSNTKMALMMVFNKSQPTTFKCSKCVIQCNNPAEMPDLTRLTEFLSNVTSHPLPIAEDSTLTTMPSADKIDIIGTGDNPQSIPDSGSVTKGEEIMASSALSSSDTNSMSQPEVGRSTKASTFLFDSGSPDDPLGAPLSNEVAPTQPTKSQTSMTSTSFDSTGDVNLQNMASSTSQLGACSSDTAQVSQAQPKIDPLSNMYPTQDEGMDTTYPQPLVNLSSTTSTSSASRGDVNIQNMASSTSLLGACSFDTPPISQASSEVDTSPDRFANRGKVIDTTYPIALFSLSTSNQPVHLLEGLRRQLPGKTIISIKDIHELASNWHLFEAILVDLGSLQQVASYSSDKFNKVALDIYQKCLKEMLVPQNIALLMLTPMNTPADHKRASDTMRQFPKMNEVPVFQYSSESCRPPLFDDITKNRLFSWLLDSFARYQTAANKKGSGFMKKVKDFVSSWF